MDWKVVFLEILNNFVVPKSLQRTLEVKQTHNLITK